MGPATVPAGSYPLGLAVSADGKSVYVSNYADEGTVSQYDVGADGRLSPKSPPTVPAGINPFGLAVNPDGKSVYVVNNYGSGSVTQFDVERGGRLSPKNPPSVAAGPSPEWLAVTPDGESVYVTNLGDGVSQYSVGSNGALTPKAPATVDVGAAPIGVAVTPINETIISDGANDVTNDPTPTFRFTSSEPGSSFRCRLDSGSYKPCTSPETTSHLADGTHTFYVRAKDSEGNIDPTPASRTFTVRTASIRVSSSALVITAAPGAKDNLQITRPSRSIVRVTDFPAGAYTGSGIHTGADCTRSGDYTANCLASAITPVLPALVTSAGQQPDRVVNSSGLPSSLYGGAGNDTLTGGSARDILNGGAGADLLSGLDGNDLLQAHDGASDQTIDCGAGSDKADLDLLPMDSHVKGCETKTRH